MKHTFLKNSRPLICAKTFPFFFDKAIFLYPAHDSKSLNAISCHKITVHIVTTKGILGGKITEDENSSVTVADIVITNVI